MVGDGSVSPEFAEIAGPSHAEGVYAPMAQTPETIPGANDWIESYKKKYGTAPGPYSNQSYDAVRLAAEAITQAGGTGSAGVLAALEMMDGFQLFSGPLKFTLEHTLANGGFQILVVKDGAFTLQDTLT
ncbi:ABC-type branched-subunit amino acid transport system substrate-binding protein [Nonomuraea thailandensis]|uniref:ABC-type branched-subunit amino acid transport system substrate-binding protein n=2 Tax=Nonomuraea thailandensis TaxID=1188745 RepID=A0A9X2G8Y5_9ACTN|nr:ABC-type branched-subunit amino acid transport system substrate-binding protein [Nonomuraea thailandensis]